jgi:hypothetical protein
VHRWRGPIIDVADTMYVMKLWFETYQIAFTAADLVGATRLVLEQKKNENDERR